jgi:hypothetical protein
MLPNSNAPPHTDVLSDPDFVLPGEEIAEQFRETPDAIPPRPEPPPGTPTEPEHPDGE